MSSIDIESSPNPVSIVSQGHILNDNGLDVDHLSHVVYAEALAQQIDSIKSPMTIGLFARWGSGKSFMLKHVQSLLKSSQKERNKKEKKIKGSTIILICYAVIVLALMGLAIAAFVVIGITVFLGISIIFLSFFLCIVCLIVSKSDSITPKPRIGKIKVIFYALFTKLPIRKNKFPEIPVTSWKSHTLIRAPKEEEKEVKKNKTNRRFIFVQYNAWQYAGSDFLWAGIVTNLAERIEKEFGILTTRLFRSLSKGIYVKPNSMKDHKKKSCKNSFFTHLLKHPRTNNVLAFLVIVSAILISAALFIYILIIDQTGDVIQGTLVDEILVFLPAAITCLLGILKCLYALYNSHEDKVKKAIQGAKKDFSSELGYMKKIRTEIQSMIDLVHTVELSYGIQYKIIITIDDLDRIPLPKVKDVLEAVNILLSDRHSPFICIIATDSRIASDCFTANKWRYFDQKNEDNIPPSVNGHEYLKKIINLPFCLHEIDDEAKPHYIYGLIEESDVLKKIKPGEPTDRESSSSPPSSPTDPGPTVSSGLSQNESSSSPSSSSPPNSGSAAPSSRSLQRATFSTLPSQHLTLKSTATSGLSRDESSLSRFSSSSPPNSGSAAPPSVSLQNESSSSPSSSSPPNSGSAAPSSRSLQRATFSPLPPQPIMFKSTATSGSSRVTIPSSPPSPAPLPSPPSPAPLPSPPVPGKPSPPKLISSTTTSITIQWDDVTGDGEKTYSVLQDGNEVKTKLKTKEATINDLTSNKSYEFQVKATNHAGDGPISDPQTLTTHIDFEDFLIECRNQMYENKDLIKFLTGNPRNLKRIFNVMSMTACLIDTKQKYKSQNQLQETVNNYDFSINAEELSCWIVLTEQWPFRVSYMLVMIEIYDQEMSKKKLHDDKIPLIDIYYRILKDDNEAEIMRSLKRLLPLDYDASILENFLISYPKLLSIGTTRRLWKYTTNLDSNLMKSISLERDSLVQLNKKNI